MISIFKNIRKITTKDEKKNGLKILSLTLMTALIDVIGAASVMPFIIVLANPNLIEENSILIYIYITLNFNSKADFFILLGCSSFGVMIFSLLMRAYTIKAQLKYSMMLEFNLSKRVLQRYLQNDYQWFLRSNSASLGKTILSEVEAIVVGGIMQILLIASQFTVVVILMILLIYTDPMLFIIVAGMLGMAYVSIFMIMSPKISKLGDMRTIANEGRYKSLAEIFGGIKQVKISHLEGKYVKSYEIPAKTYAEIRATFSTMVQIPRFALEGIAFGGVIALLIILIIREQNLSTIMPTITLYALAGYRVMPALQIIYAGFTQLNFVGPTLENLKGELEGLIIQTRKLTSKNADKLNEAIILKDINFKYNQAHNYSIKNLSMTVERGERIGIVGSTGSGKSTMVDLILGLLKPESGSLSIGKIDLNSENIRDWQKKIGYVAQNIYLCDGTIAQNIAFGIDENEINYMKVELASKTACLHDFVIGNLPDGYDTKVGERGIRLSGGERQRIGIARALYENPEVLILDEATSALDNITEAKVMQSVTSLDSSITLIVIAHRLSTVKSCNRLYLLDEGKIVAQGSYEDLVCNNSSFKQMVEISQ
jgi:ABC-type multidrug transport system fused ATPase/permease subunit